MKFIITDFFEKQFKKTVTDVTMDELIWKIHAHSKNFVHLPEPYVKVKIRTPHKSYRLVVIFDAQDSVVLLVNIFDKKNKTYGEKLNWKLHKDDILSWTDKNTVSLQSGKYVTRIL